MAGTRTVTAAALAAQVRRDEASCVDHVRTALDRSHAAQRGLNCFTEVFDESALAEARRIDSLGASARADLPLCGVPVAIKDFTPIAGKRTTFGSIAFRDHVATEDALIVRRLRAAGAIILGHTTTPEFAWSGRTESRLWGVTRNPFDPARISGGSSGGSAAAVAAGCVFLAEGTDMGGSVRIPAALCGVVGMKPSFGRIPMDMLASQFDTLAHFGPLARSVGDAALFLSVCEGPDEADMLSLPPLPAVWPLAPWPRAPRLAVSTDLDAYVVSQPVKRLFERLIGDLTAMGADITPVRTPVTMQTLEDWEWLWAWVMAGDYGHLLEEFRTVLDPGVISLIETGRRLRATDIRQIDHRRTQLWRSFARLIAPYDAFLCPTMTATARLAEAPPDPPQTRHGRYDGYDMTGPFNMLSGLPVVSVPMGLAADGLPAGVQVVGKRHDDRMALAIAALIEHIRPAPIPPDGAFLTPN